MGRTIGNIEIKEDRRDDCTLGDTKMDYTGTGRGMVVGTGCHAAAEVGGEPTNYVILHGGLGKFLKE